VTPVVLALSLAYAAVAGLLLTFNLSTRYAFWIKGAAITVVSGLYAVTWISLGGLMGWATADPMPADFRVLWISTDEPDKGGRQPGTIYFWVRALDEAGLPVGAPRAHKVPWSEATAEAAEAAMAQIEEGELLNGRIGRGLVAQSESTSEETSYAGEQSVSGSGGDRPAFEFIRVPPPALPPKSNLQ
jgi:hypothetical protein